MIRNVWFISDTHFGHEKIIPYCRPQFASLAEMERQIIDRWNASVRADDLVYHLGDFAWTLSDAVRVRPLLNGTIRLIVGNHDDIIGLSKAGLFQRMDMWRQFPEMNVTASHVPLHLDQLRRSRFNLHGHVHGNLAGLGGFHRDVSVESTGYQPVHIDAIAAWAAEASEASS